MVYHSKSSIQQEESSFHQQIRQKFKEGTGKMSSFMVLKLGHFGKKIKYLESFEIWCWRRMERIIWTDHVKNEEVLQSHGGKGRPTYNKQKEG